MFLTKIAEQSGLLAYVVPPKKMNQLEIDDEELAKKLQAKEYKRYCSLRSQFEEERAAETRGTFAKRQRVQYLHKQTNTNYDAVIQGVHLDDGPDRPYYTIKYKRPETIFEEDGSEREEIIEIEKQTTPDRLRRVVWDEDEVEIRNIQGIFIWKLLFSLKLACMSNMMIFRDKCFIHIYASMFTIKTGLVRVIRNLGVTDRFLTKIYRPSKS